jgi:hypothetical protein
MASRNSRGKGKVKKQPELRTGGGRAAKAARSRERNAAVARSSARGPAVRMRPAGVAGMLYVELVAWIGVALVALAGALLHRWDILSYPDSLWLFVAFGTFAVAPAVGRVARSAVDADAWGLQALLVPLVLLVAEALLGPGCPTGGSCASVGARGSLGTFWSIVVVLALAAAAWGLARWMYRAAANRRPASGRVGYRIVTSALLMLLAVPGVILAATLIGTDLLARDTPGYVAAAKDEVTKSCFADSDSPTLAVRAAPIGYTSEWTTFAVRNADEHRKGIGSKPLPKDWAGLDDVYPYEATVSYNRDGDAIDVSCGKVNPDSGRATAADTTQEEPSDVPFANKTIGHEFLPRFIADGQAGPTPEALKKQAAAAKAKAAAAKAKKSSSTTAK